MHYKKELCRNFQRGSCQYGERCKFLHVTQQQPKSNPFGFGTQPTSNQQQPKSNPFGFGTQPTSNQQQPKSNPFGFGTQSTSNQQQKPNPFGFGVQNNAPSKGNNDFGNKQSQFKNTWTRPSGTSATPSSRQPDNQPQASNHKCTDPESCKRIIAEDFQHERPLWKLTCYGHWKNSPCDIVGDVSYEELRAAAYDDAKRGLSLQSIVERERNLLNSKLMEFENLLRNPYKGPAGSTLAQQVPFPGAPATAFSPTAQNSAPSQNGFPPSLSSFSQLGASSPFAPNNTPLVNAVSVSSQPPKQSDAASFTTNMSIFSNNSVNNTALNQFPAPAVPTQSLNSSSMQPLFNVSNSVSQPSGQAATDVQLGNLLPRKIVSGESSIWLKEKWIPGEIPEEAPPDAYV